MSMDVRTLTPEAIGSALGRIPSGCSILTLSRGDQSTGVLLSWVQQAAFDPPAVSFCVKRGRPVESLLQTGGRFLLNIIGEEPADMFRHFGRGFSLDDNAFAGLQITPSDFGPIVHACPAQLGCELRDHLTIGDHNLYVGLVLAGSFQTDFKPYVHLRRNGLSY